MSTSEQIHFNERIIEIPSPDSSEFKKLFAKKCLKNIFQKNNPEFKASHKLISSSTLLTNDIRQEWQKFVNSDTTNEWIRPYFLHAALHNTLELLNKSKVPLIKLVHLKSSVQVLITQQLSENSELQVTQKITQVMNRKNGFMIEVTGEIYANNIKIRTQWDSFYVKNTQLDLQKSDIHIGDCSHLIRYVKSKKASIYGLTSNSPIPITITKGLPLRYAKVSGDYNLLHATKLGAKLCGQKDAFLQGTALQTLCWNALQCHSSKPITHVEILFAKPAFVRKTYALWYTDKLFELVDEHMNVIAFGDYAQRTL